MYESVNMTKAQLEERLREVIVNLVNNGYQKVIPGSFSKTLRREREINIDPSLLGNVLSDMGLDKGRTSKSRYYKLPKQEDLGAWLDGVL